MAGDVLRCTGRGHPAYPDERLSTRRADASSGAGDSVQANIVMGIRLVFEINIFLESDERKCRRKVYIDVFKH